jgi:hypothetical protein
MKRMINLSKKLIFSLKTVYSPEKWSGFNKKIFQCPIGFLSRTEKQKRYNYKTHKIDILFKDQ